MQQQINLYQHLMKQYQHHIRYRLVLGGYAIFFILLMLYYSFEVFHKNRQVNIIKTLEFELSQQQNHLSQLTQSFSGSQRIEEALNVIGQQSVKNEISPLLSQDGFSDYLTELARATPAGVWITQIQLMKGGSIINLIGKAVEAINVQKFSEQLNNQSFFVGKKFEVVSLTNVKETESEINYFDFQIKTKVS